MIKYEKDDSSTLFDFVRDFSILDEYNKKSEIPSIKVLIEVKFKDIEDDDFYTFCILTEHTLQLSGKIMMISREEKNNLYKILLASYQKNEFEKPIYGGRQISDGSSYSYKIKWNEVQCFDTLKDQMSLGFEKIIDSMHELISCDNAKTKIKLNEK